MNETEELVTLHISAKNKNHEGVKETVKRKSKYMNSKESSRSTVNHMETKENTEDSIDEDEHPKVNSDEISPSPNLNPGHYQTQFASTLAIFDTQPRVRLIPVCGLRGGR